MGHFSVEITGLPGSLLSGNQHPDVQHSLDLLTEIRSSELLQRPRYVLGITADLEISKQVKTSFEDWTWTVLKYSSTDDEWINRTLNCATFIGKDAANGDEQTIDIAILCALAKPELEEVLKLPWNWSSARPIDDGCAGQSQDGRRSVRGSSMGLPKRKEGTRWGQLAVLDAPTSASGPSQDPPPHRTDSR